MINKLVIISNESIFKDNNIFYCDNIDMKSIPEGLKKKFEVLLIGRKSKVKRSHKIDLLKVEMASNMFSFLIDIFKTFKDKEKKYLLISITPYTFLASFLLFIFRKNFFVYLRSNGYEEYKCILGFIGPFLYHIMFTIVAWKAKLISCRSHLLNGKFGKIVSPSQLSEKWFLSHQRANVNEIELLYVGRIKIEKGVFSLLKILKNLKIDVKLSIIGVGKNNKNEINQKNVKVVDFENKNDAIIKMYDTHNIFILPSFTESHPQVLDESLARRRPVIVFEDISHVIGDRKGVFVSKRDAISLSKTINYIMNNYQSIQEKIMENALPTKANFLKEMVNIIEEN